MKVQASMISLAMEYVQNQAEKVYIYCISEEALLSFDIFYKINGILTKMYAVNEIRLIDKFCWWIKFNTKLSL